MFEILAQGTAEAVGIAVGAAVIVLTGGKGLDALRNRRASSSSRPKVCALHDQLVALLDERKESQNSELKQLREEHKDFERRTDTNFRDLFQLIRDKQK